MLSLENVGMENPEEITSSEGNVWEYHRFFFIFISLEVLLKNWFGVLFLQKVFFVSVEKTNQLKNQSEVTGSNGRSPVIHNFYFVLQMLYYCQS